MQPANKVNSGAAKEIAVNALEEAKSSGSRQQGVIVFYSNGLQPSVYNVSALNILGLCCAIIYN
jgi:hypothetical protein